SWRVRSRGLSFFFQAEDGIRDLYVTGVQTCALPIYRYAAPRRRLVERARRDDDEAQRIGDQVDQRVIGEQARIFGEDRARLGIQIGRASCRERVQEAEGDGSVKKKSSYSEPERT